MDFPQKINKRGATLIRDSRVFIGSDTPTLCYIYVIKFAISEKATLFQTPFSTLRMLDLTMSNKITGTHWELGYSIC